MYRINDRTRALNIAKRAERHNNERKEQLDRDNRYQLIAQAVQRIQNK